MFRRSLLSTAAIIALTTVVIAQSDPIAARRDTMKGVGAAAGAGVKMVKGEVPFDLAKAQEIFATYAKAAETNPALYPETSKTGGGTTASPAVWEKSAEFNAAFAAWSSEIKTASAATKDLATFQASFGSVMKACGACHTTFRVKT